MAGESVLRMVAVYPRLLGTYGDGGNGVVLSRRAAMRGYDVELAVADPGERVPSRADIYLLGGGEDDAQVAATAALRADGGLCRAVTNGAVIFAVCAGYQLLGATFPDARGRPTAGLGLLDAVTRRHSQRAVGEIVCSPLAAGLTDLLTGFENHAGATALGDDASPLAQVLAGTGNGRADARQRRLEGAVQGRLIGTYLHGPVLARNPQLADHLLAAATGTSLSPLGDPEIDMLRAERISGRSGVSRTV